MALLKVLKVILLVALLPELSKAVVEKRVFEKRDLLSIDCLNSHKPNPSLALTFRIGLTEEYSPPRRVFDVSITPRIEPIRSTLDSGTGCKDLFTSI